MSIDDLIGKLSEVKPKPTSNLINTELYHLITQESHGTDFSFNILKILPKGLVKEQAHADEHAIFVLDGKCRIQLSDNWVNAEKDDYIYIPPNMTHAFSNVEEKPVKILILKKK